MKIKDKNKIKKLSIRSFLNMSYTQLEEFGESLPREWRKKVTPNILLCKGMDDYWVIYKTFRNKRGKTITEFQYRGRLIQTHYNNDGKLIWRKEQKLPIYNIGLNEVARDEFIKQKRNYENA